MLKTLRGPVDKLLQRLLPDLMEAATALDTEVVALPQITVGKEIGSAVSVQAAKDISVVAPDIARALGDSGLGLEVLDRSGEQDVLARSRRESSLVPTATEEQERRVAVDTATIVTGRAEEPEGSEQISAGEVRQVQSEVKEPEIPRESGSETHTPSSVFCPSRAVAHPKSKASRAKGRVRRVLK